MQSWIGGQKSDMIKQWGPPSRYESDGDEGEIMIYGSSRTLYQPAYGGSVVQRQITDYVQVYCDKNGRIYQIRTGRQ